MTIIRLRPLATFALLTLAVPAVAATLKCAADSAKVGNTCVDKYEASVWQIPVTNTGLIKKVQTGKATLADLAGAGAVQLGCAFGVFSHTAYPAGFPPNGQWTPVFGSDPPSPGIYAASVAGVLPSTCITWFQAAQACALSGKHLITNREWQDAAAGTPDPGPADNNTTDCETGIDGAASDPVITGSRSGCQSHWGVLDMVGNVSEWAGDWGDSANNCTNWSATFGSDTSCVGGPGSGYSNLPGALTRGGDWGFGASAGVFAVDGLIEPWDSSAAIGFRCAR